MLLAAAAAFVAPAAGEYSVLVFGDSWGTDLWTDLQATFDNHSVPATVQSTAIGGTSACQWAADSAAMLKSVQQTFPDLPEGPDFVWYSLGGNDLAADKAYRTCSSEAATEDAARTCFRAAIERVDACTSTLLEAYWGAYPRSKVFQCAYDLQCLEDSCIPTAVARTPFCGSNVTCHTTMHVYWQELEIAARQQKYPQPQYHGLNILGTVQKAAGVPGADVGKPALDQGGPCEWESGCVHPKKDTPAWYAVGEAFWDLFFSRYIQQTEVVV